MTGIFIVFKIQQAQIRKEIKQQIKAGIPENELHSFNLSVQEYEKLEWVREDIEFGWNHEMFDIVKFDPKGDSIHLLCVNDKEETILFAELDKLMQVKTEKESNNSNRPLKKVVKILKLTFVSNDFYYQLPLNHPPALTNFDELNSLYSSPCLETALPPPITV